MNNNKQLIATCELWFTKAIVVHKYNNAIEITTDRALPADTFTQCILCCWYVQLPRHCIERHVQPFCKELDIDIMFYQQQHRRETACK